MYIIEFVESIIDDLANLRAYDRTNLLDTIETQLIYQPTQPTRNKKILIGLSPTWEHVPPIWELRIGEYRVFYDVNELTLTVVVRAIRHKPPHKTTEEIL
jgi:mRNA-degrading endonuclease RelE of RelBE toxin-antitoxin system